MILKPVNLTLAAVMEADDKYFPLNASDMARLVEHIPDGDETILTIHDDLYTEWVRVENQCGTLVVHRAQGGSTARKFPRGACVFFETSLPVIQWLICNYDCCAEGECVQTPVSVAQSSVSAAVVGQPWEGRVRFSGSTPINFSVDGMPGWMSAEIEDQRVILSGTAPASGTATVSIAASNCQGSATVAHQVTVVASDA